MTRGKKAAQAANRRTGEAQQRVDELTAQLAELKAAARAAELEHTGELRRLRREHAVELDERVQARFGETYRRDVADAAAEGIAATRVELWARLVALVTEWRVELVAHDSELDELAGELVRRIYAHDADAGRVTLYDTANRQRRRRRRLPAPPAERVRATSDEPPDA